MRDYNARLQRGCGEGTPKNDAGTIDDVKTFHLVKVSNEFTNDHGNSLRMPAVLISSRCLNASAILAMSSAETFERSNDTFHSLTGQAVALNAMFNSFSKRAIHADVMPTLDTYFRLALKAQSQCRSTVEAIAEIKYPKSATFIKQANIAGQQQVNNSPRSAGSGASPLTREKNVTPTNELLTGTQHAQMDTRGTKATGRGNSDVEALGEIDRADVRCG